MQATQRLYSVERPRFAVAPMMEWTDRHCRFLHRQLTRRALLYTEMVVAEAAIRGDRDRLLGFDAAEHPVALQIGGSEPARLAEAARIGEQFGYAEINLNVGCPSDRVQSGTFGACLMRSPRLVGECVAAMRSAVTIPVTVKCRIGVDEQETGPALDELARAVWDAGAEGLWVHARKAWLEGLSPKENREIPPLDYERVRRLKRENPSHFIGLNGGLHDLNQALRELIQVPPDAEPLDGAMFGRAAYHNALLLRGVDRIFYGETREPQPLEAVVDTMIEYASRHVEKGGRLNHVTRHMVGMFHGMRGARHWRHMLSQVPSNPEATPRIIAEAFSQVSIDAPAEAA
jgi:tRNA-dihydrouridine synthase A